jgi:hypothetical protein
MSGRNKISRTEWVLRDHYRRFESSLRDRVERDFAGSKMRPLKGFETPATIADLYVFKYSNSALRAACVKTGCAKGGNKTALYIRLYTRWYFSRMAARIARAWREHGGGSSPLERVAAKYIQAIVRGFLVRKYHRRLKGLLFPSARARCVNQVDVISLDDIREIPARDFVFLPYHSGHYYGMHVDSIADIVLHKTGRPLDIFDSSYYNWLRTAGKNLHIQNPWTRGDIPVRKIYSNMRAQRRMKEKLGIVPRRLCPPLRSGTKGARDKSERLTPARSYIRSRSLFDMQLISREHLPRETVRRAMEATTADAVDRVLRPYQTNITRSINMFGFEFRTQWLTSMAPTDIVRFVTRLCHAWCYKFAPTMAPHTRAAFFPSFPDGNPFRVLSRSPSYMVDMNHNTRLLAMLVIIDKFITDSMDPELNALGVMYVMGCMTHVVPEARELNPWLYDEFEFERIHR